MCIAWPTVILQRCLSCLTCTHSHIHTQTGTRTHTLGCGKYHPALYGRMHRKRGGMHFIMQGVRSRRRVNEIRTGGSYKDTNGGWWKSVTFMWFSNLDVGGASKRQLTVRKSVRIRANGVGVQTDACNHSSIGHYRFHRPPSKSVLDPPRHSRSPKQFGDLHCDHNENCVRNEKWWRTRRTSSVL